MKTKFGFQFKKEYSVKEIATEVLLVTPSVLQNYLYKKGMVAKLGCVYNGDDLISIFEDYSKEAYLRKAETIKRAKWMSGKLKGGEVKEEEVVEVKESIDKGEEVKEEIIVEAEKKEEEVVEVKEIEFWKRRDNILRVINLVSVLSSLIGIGKELGFEGVISIGLMTSFLLVYCLLLVQDKNANKGKRDVTVFFMLIVEGFWGIFHNKTFEGFNSDSAVFGNNTSVWTAVIIAVLSFGVLLVQTFNDED